MIPGSLSNSNALLAYCDDFVIRSLVETQNSIKVNSEIKKHESKCMGLDWSRIDERYFLSADQDRNIFLWDMNYNLSNPVVQGRSVEAVSDIQFVPYNGSMIFGVDDNGGFTLWDIRNQSNFYKTMLALSKLSKAKKRIFRELSNLTFHLKNQTFSSPLTELNWLSGMFATWTKD